MSNIPLARPTPRRLHFDGRDWSLEVVRWQAVDREVFSPFSSFVLGTEAILRHLAELGEEQALLSDSRTVMGKPAAAGTAYEYADARWHAVARTADATSLRPGGQTTELAERVHELEDQIDGLRNRLAELENEVAMKARRARLSSMPPPRQDLDEPARETG